MGLGITETHKVKETCCCSIERDAALAGHYIMSLQLHMHTIKSGGERSSIHHPQTDIHRREAVVRIAILYLIDVSVNMQIFNLFFYGW